MISMHEHVQRVLLAHQNTSACGMYALLLPSEGDRFKAHAIIKSYHLNRAGHCMDITAGCLFEPNCPLHFSMAFLGRARGLHSRLLDTIRAGRAPQNNITALSQWLSAKMRIRGRSGTLFPRRHTFVLLATFASSACMHCLDITENI